MRSGLLLARGPFLFVLAAGLGLGVACATGSSSSTIGLGDAGSDTGLVLVDAGGGVVIVTTPSNGGSGTGTTTSTGTAEADSGNTATTGGQGDDAGSTSDAGCVFGEIMCATGCADTATDSDNCGTCGNVCSTGSCSGGTCGGGQHGFDAGDEVDSGSGVDSGIYDYTCSHSPCVTGGPLTRDCDEYGDAIVAIICSFENYPQCCSQEWTMICVEGAEELEEEQCIGHHGQDFCLDPGC
jgi:hypothetical protein